MWKFYHSWFNLIPALIWFESIETCTWIVSKLETGSEWNEPIRLIDLGDPFYRGLLSAKLQNLWFYFAVTWTLRFNPQLTKIKILIFLHLWCRNIHYVGIWCLWAWMLDVALDMFNVMKTDRISWNFDTLIKGLFSWGVLKMCIRS